jgi:hypothetical protein
MRNNGALWTRVGVGMVMFALAAAARTAAGTWPERTTYLTFDRAVQLPGVTLEKGTYIFELLDSASAPGVVCVVSRDRKVAYFMGLTNAAERPRGLRLDVSVSLGEARAGAAPPITVWWPIGERTGRAFIYPGR